MIIKIVNPFRDKILVAIKYYDKCRRHDILNQILENKFLVIVQTQTAKTN